MISSQSKLYMIKHKLTGQMKKSGSGAEFATWGKLWYGIGRLKNHLRMYDNPRMGETFIGRMQRIFNYRNIRIEDCEVVEVEIREVSRKPLKDFIEKDMK